VDTVRAVIHESLENFEIENAIFHAEALYAEVISCLYIDPSSYTAF